MQTVSGAQVRLMLRFAEKSGVAPPLLLLELDQKEDLLQHPDQRVPVRLVQDLWGRLAAHLRSPGFALEMGGCADPSMFGLVGVLAASSPNLLEAAQLLSRYQQLLATDCAWTIVLSKRYFDLEFILQGELPDAVARYPIELSFASMLAGLRKLSGVKVWPIECAFSYSKPEYYKAYESCFGGSVYFGAQRNRMRFAAEVAGLSVLSALPSLRQVLEQSAHDSCKAMTEGKSWTSRVKTQIGFLLDSGHWASAQTLATRLGCSQRTLARHLLLEGSSLRQMLDEARLAKSKALLLNKAHSLEDIACSLGFSELRSFHRAFSRWSGMSPSRFRKLSGV